VCVRSVKGAVLQELGLDRPHRAPRRPVDLVVIFRSDYCSPISGFCPLTGIRARGWQGSSCTANRLAARSCAHMKLDFPLSSLFREGRF
jgi:hypothetical protein